MAYTMQQIPVNTPYYDMTTDTVKQDGLRWQILEDTVNKIFAINPDVPIQRVWYQPNQFLDPTPYIRGGFAPAMGGYMCWLLNNRPV